MSPCLKAVAGGVEIRVKVVPGASRSRVDGLYGDSLKVRVSAPPERGKANEAVVSLVAELLGSNEATVEVVAGLTSPRKTIRISQRTLQQVEQALGLRK
jgi:uncharacterized protein (TIGR00251 family)